MTSVRAPNLLDAKILNGRISSQKFLGSRSPDLAYALDSYDCSRIVHVSDAHLARSSGVRVAPISASLKRVIGRQKKSNAPMSGAGVRSTEVSAPLAG